MVTDSTFESESVDYHLAGEQLEVLSRIAAPIHRLEQETTGPFFFTPRILIWEAYPEFPLHVAMWVRTCDVQEHQDMGVLFSGPR